MRRSVVTLAAALVTAGVCSALQTQLNLHELARLGVDAGWQLRAATTAEDMARFGPVMFGFTLVAALLSLPLRALLRHLGLNGLGGTLLAWLLALLAVLMLLRDVVPMPAIAATRSLPGLLLMALCGLAGGALSHALVRRRARIGTRPPAHQVMLIGVGILLPALSFLLMRPVAQHPTPPTAQGYVTTTVATGLQRPWALAELPDGRWLVTEMAGRLLMMDRNGAREDVNLAEIPATYHQGRSIGLMDVALSPTFLQDNNIYLTQGYRSPQGVGVRLLRGVLEHAPRGWSFSQVEVMFESTAKPRDGNNGGRVAFLDPHTLLMTVGDGSARREQAQNPHTSLGKVMRIPLDPHPSASGGARVATATVYSSGHRNPQGIVRDPASGQIYVSEHGPRGGDELNRLRQGGNHGWPVVSHGIDYPFARVSPFTRLAGYDDPELVWSPSIAPAGLTIYQGTLFNGWQGDFLVPTLRERGIRRLVRENGRIVRQERLLAHLDARIRDVRVAADGTLHVLTDGPDARLLRLSPSRVAPPQATR